MHVKLRNKIHNRFDVHVYDIETKKTEVFHAYNIILDGYWTSLLSGNGGGGMFDQIAIGRGTGTLEKTRTSLFNQIASLTAANPVNTFVYPTASWRKSIVLASGDYVGETITEVGIRGGSFQGSRLHTHAFLEDAEGNIISLPKTNTMVVTIYATFFSTPVVGVNEVLSHIPADNFLLRAPIDVYSYGRGLTFRANRGQEMCSNRVHLASLSGAQTFDIPNKRATYASGTISESTGQGDYQYVEIANSVVMKLTDIPGFTGHPLTAVPLGVGDGVKKFFTPNIRNILPASAVVKVNGVVVDPANYTLSMRESINDGHYFDLGFAPVNGPSLACSRNGEYLMVSSGSSGNSIQVSSYDETTKKCSLLATITLPSGYPQIGSISDNGEVICIAAYVSNSQRNRIYRKISGIYTLVLDIASAQVRPSCSSDGNRVLLSTGENTSRCYEWNGTDYVALGASLNNTNATHISMSADGNTIAGTTSAAPYFVVSDWDTVGGAWVARNNSAYTRVGTGNPWFFGMSSDGLTVAINDGHTVFDVLDWDPVGKSWTQRPSVSRSAIGGSMAYFADGKKTLLVSDGTNPPVTVTWDSSLTQHLILPHGLRTGSIVAGQVNSNIVLGTGYKVGSVLPMSQSSPTSVRAALEISPRMLVVEFTTPPAGTLPVTIDCTVDGIYKTTNWKVQGSCSVEYAEPTP